MIYAWDVPSSVTYTECAALAAVAEGSEHVLEVGSWFGRSTILLSSVCGHVTAVDWHHGDFHAGELDTEEGFRANLARYGVENVTVVVAKVEDVADELGGPFDGVFVDAAHDAEAVGRHWFIASRVVKPGGWVAFHDYGRFGVTEVLDGLERGWDVTESLAVTRL
jgi:predicted O-methyltransferase YrrM